MNIKSQDYFVLTAATDKYFKTSVYIDLSYLRSFWRLLCVSLYYGDLEVVAIF